MPLSWPGFSGPKFINAIASSIEPALGRGLAFCEGKVGNGLSWEMVVGDVGAMRGRSLPGLIRIVHIKHSQPLCRVLFQELRLPLTYQLEVASCLPGLVPWVGPHLPGPLALAGLVAAVVGDIAGHSLGPVKAFGPAAAAAVARSCRHILVAGRGSSHRPGCSNRHPTVRIGLGRSRSLRTAGRIGRRNPGVVSLAAGRLDCNTAAGGAVAGNCRIAAVAAAGRPLAQARDGRR